MNVTINGEPKELDGDSILLPALLTVLGLGQRRVAVELNETIIKRDGYGQTMLKDGDAIEIVHFVGGG